MPERERALSPYNALEMIVTLSEYFNEHDILSKEQFLSLLFMKED